MASEPTETSPLLPDTRLQLDANNPGTLAPVGTSATNDFSTNTQASQTAESNHTETEDDSNRHVDWRRLFVFMLPYLCPSSIRLRVCMFLSFLFVLLERVITLVPPLAMKWTVDSLSSTNPNIAKTVPYLAIGALYLGRVSNSIVSAVRELTYSVLSTEQTRIFSVASFRHIQRLDVSYHVNRKTGEVLQAMGRGASSMNSFIRTSVFTFVPTILEAIMICGIFLKIGIPVIGLTTLASVCLYIFYTKVVTEKIVKTSRSYNETMEAVSTQEIDTLTNYETVKYFGNEEYESKQYDILQAELQKKDIKLDAIYEILFIGQSLIEATGTILSLLLAANATANGSLTPGDFVMVSEFIGQLFGPFAYIGEFYSSLVKNATDIEKSIDLFNTKSRVNDRSDALQLQISEQELLENKKGSLRFENVSFKYETSDGRTGGVKNLSFNIRSGQMLGIVGSSGAGKSTLARLLVRFYDPDEGRVLINDEDIQKFTQSSVRSIFGVVAQDTCLFNRSLRYNISYGKIGATDQEIYKACEAAQLSKFLDQLPEGLDTLVGERGIKLSGGERQRVGVARCILRKPLFVLLDEASSSLDSETEKEMQKAVQEIIRGRTTVAIAHRLSTVMNADRIIVMDNGMIIEEGTHTELVLANGKYKSMWIAQTEAKEE